MLVKLDDLRLDGDTQPRAFMDGDVVVEYRADMENGAVFPPPVVFFDGKHRWVADGFHRIYAHEELNRVAIECDVRSGSLDDAKLFAASANAKHGFRRSKADWKKAIEMVQSTEKGSKWTQKEIAAHCHISQQYVSKVLGPESSKTVTTGCNSAKLPQSKPTTQTEEKRARVAAEIAANPGASNRAISRKAGVDDKTVASVRERQESPRGAPAPRSDLPSPPPPKKPSDAKGGYSSATARDTAKAAKDAYRFARENLRDNDWDLFRSEIDELNAVRSRPS